MAIDTPSAAADAVVVALPSDESQRARADLAELGPVQRLAPGLLILRLASPAKDPRDAWQSVLDGCREALWVAPVLRDAEGNELFPSGSVGVRFHQAPSDKALKAFASDEGLAFERRNEFVKEQASFYPRQPRQAYLPELVARIAVRPEVAAAWAATVSRYRRA